MGVGFCCLVPQYGRGQRPLATYPLKSARFWGCNICSELQTTTLKEVFSKECVRVELSLGKLEWGVFGVAESSSAIASDISSSLAVTDFLARKMQLANYCEPPPIRDSQVTVSLVEVPYERLGLHFPILFSWELLSVITAPPITPNNFWGVSKRNLQDKLHLLLLSLLHKICHHLLHQNILRE